MAKKKQSKASWRKRGADIEEALRSAREAADRERRTGGTLGHVPSDQLFSIEARAQAPLQPKSKRERREAQPALWVDRVIAGNAHIEPVMPPRQRAKPKQDAVVRKKAAPAPTISKRSKSKALKLAPLLPAPGPAGQLPRTMLGELKDVWGEAPLEPEDATITAVREVVGEEALVPSKRRPVARSKFVPRSSFTPESTGKQEGIAKVKIPDGGASFNPERDAHAQRLQAAIAHEMERIRREERPKWKVDKERIEEAARLRLAAMHADGSDLKLLPPPGMGEEEEEEEEESDDSEVAAGAKEVVNKKKTAQQLARAKRTREREAAEAASKAERKREKQLGRIGPITSEITKEERELKRRQAEAAEREQSRRRKLGKLKYGERRPEVLCSDELVSSLRALPHQPETDLMAERFDSMRERNLIEVRSRARKPKRPKRNVYTRESHKDRRYSATGKPVGFDKSEAPVWV